MLYKGARLAEGVALVVGVCIVESVGKQGSGGLLDGYGIGTNTDDDDDDADDDVRQS